MKTGIQVFFQSIPSLTDYQVLEQETAIALRAEELGFDYLLSPEHHFVDYSIAPDPLQFLPLGDGVLDFREILRAIVDAGYDDWLMVELDSFDGQPGAAARRSKAYLDALLADLGIG